jgi:nucleotide-binding universal stress UspA family protein
MFAPTNILIPTDFSDPSGTALNYAKDIARLNNATLHIVHVIEIIVYPIGWTYPEADAVVGNHFHWENSENELQKLAKTLAHEDFHVRTQTLEGGDPSNEIVDYANKHNIDLICIATHGRTGLGRLFLGSTTERVIRKAHCPVLTVHRSKENEKAG